MNFGKLNPSQDYIDSEFWIIEKEAARSAKDVGQWINEVHDPVFHNIILGNLAKLRNLV